MRLGRGDADLQPRQASAGTSSETEPVIWITFPCDDTCCCRRTGAVKLTRVDGPGVVLMGQWGVGDEASMDTGQIRSREAWQMK